MTYKGAQLFIYIQIEFPYFNLNGHRQQLLFRILTPNDCQTLLYAFPGWKAAKSC